MKHILLSSLLLMGLATPLYCPASNVVNGAYTASKIAVDVAIVGVGGYLVTNGLYTSNFDKPTIALMLALTLGTTHAAERIYKRIKKLRNKKGITVKVQI